MALYPRPNDQLIHPADYRPDKVVIERDWPAANYSGDNPSVGWSTQYTDDSGNGQNIYEWWCNFYKDNSALPATTDYDWDDMPKLSVNDFLIIDRDQRSELAIPGGTSKSNANPSSPFLNFYWGIRINDSVNIYHVNQITSDNAGTLTGTYPSEPWTVLCRFGGSTNQFRYIVLPEILAQAEIDGILPAAPLFVSGICQKVEISKIINTDPTLPWTPTNFANAGTAKFL